MERGLLLSGLMSGRTGRVSLFRRVALAATAAGVPLTGKAAILVGLAFVLGATLLFRLRTAQS